MAQRERVSTALPRTMPPGRPEGCQAEARSRFQTVENGSGLIRPAAVVPGRERPWEKVAAFFKAGDKAPKLQ